MVLKNKWKAIFFPGALAALWALFHFRVLFLGHTFVLGDSSRFFFPLWKWGAEVWKGGLVPLWNPDAGFGTPYLADPQMAAWYPPLRSLYSCLGPVDAFNACLAGHHLWALLGFYFFARSRSFSGTSAFLGALFFGFSIHAVSLTALSSLSLSLSWIPWVFLSAGYLVHSSKGGFLSFSFCLAMQMASGFPLTAGLTLLVLGMERLCGKEKSGDPWKTALTFLAAIGSAAAFNLAWGIPFGEFLGHSNAAQRLSFHQSEPLEVLLTWLNPFRLGHPLHSPGEGLFELSSYFMGLPALLLVLWGAFTRKLSWVPVLLAGIWVLLSMGNSTWPGEWAEKFLPFYEWVARPGYWMPMVIFSAARLAMEAAERKTEPGKTPARFDGAWMALSALVFGTALAAGMPGTLRSFWAALLLCLLLGTTLARTPVLRKVLLFGAVLFSMGPAVEGVRFSMDRSYYEKPPAILGEMPRPGRIYVSFPVAERFRGFAGGRVAVVYEGFKNALVSDLPLGFGREVSYFYSSLFLRDPFQWGFSSMRFSERVSRESLDYLGIRYVLGAHHFPGFRWISKDPDPVPVSENLMPSNKWVSIREALPASDWRSDMERLDRAGYSLKRTCFVPDPAKAGVYSLRKVTEGMRTANRVEVSAAGKGRALLVSSETDYPGWNVEIGKKRRPVDEVNHGFRALALEEGEERAVLIYRPASFRLGCFLSLLVCGLWAGMAGRLGSDLHA